MTAPAHPAKRLPASIWALGFVSLLMDVSSEMIHSLLPVFLVTSLGVSMLAVGLIEGAAEATALVLKVFSGVLSDWWGRRKPLAVLGYGLGALSKPLFAIAPTVGWVVTRRASLTGWARAYAVRRVMHWWPTWRHPACGARRSGCGSRWTPWAPFWAPCWPWG